VEHIEGRELVEEELRRADQVLSARLDRKPGLGVVRVDGAGPAGACVGNPRAGRNRIAAAAGGRACYLVRTDQVPRPSGGICRRRDCRGCDYGQRGDGCSDGSPHVLSPFDWKNRLRSAPFHITDRRLCVWCFDGDTSCRMKCQGASLVVLFPQVASRFWLSALRTMALH